LSEIKHLLAVIRQLLIPFTYTVFGGILSGKIESIISDASDLLIQFGANEQILN
jgi:hypothetical protein